MISSPNVGDRVRNTATGSVFKVTQIRAVVRRQNPPFYWPPSTVNEVELVADDGFVSGWVTEDALNTSEWEDVAGPGVSKASWLYSDWPSSHKDWQPEPQPPKCDCGGAKASTSHSAWCSTVSK